MLQKNVLNNVPVYNLSSVGKALPAWLTSKRKAVHAQKPKRRTSASETEQIELIQDLYFPTACARVKVSSDGETLIAAGSYPPQLRAFELRELSQKFARHFNAPVVQFQILSDDWRKLVFLFADRTVEFHTQYGKHHSTRIPHHGRDLAYQPETCELLLAGAGEEIFRLNLERGQFMAPLTTGCSGVNALVVDPTHGMLAAGTVDGTIQCWDPRTRRRIGTSSPFDAIEAEYAALDAQPEITSLRFDSRGLLLAAGTSSGHVALYDIRRAAPLVVKDHNYGFPIVDLKWHGERIVSSDRKAIRVWSAELGAAAPSTSTFTSIQPPADVNDVALFPGSGLLVAALESERLGAYFIPSLGPAPRWCHFLDGLTEEMEEVKTSAVYDDYKFVTREELESLNITSLLGTKMLRPYLHGFFIDARLHKRAVALSQPFAYEQWRKERLKQKLEAKAADRIAPVARTKPPKVNAEYAKELQRGAKKVKRSTTATDDGTAAGGVGLLDDERFKSLFSDPDFKIDQESDEYLALKPHARNANAGSLGAAKQAAARRAANEESDDDAANDVSSEEGSETAGSDDENDSVESDMGSELDDDDEGSRAEPRMVSMRDSSGGGVEAPKGTSFGERLKHLPTESAAYAHGASELTFRVREANGGGAEGRGKGRGKGRGTSEGRGMGGKGRAIDLVMSTLPKQCIGGGLAIAGAALAASQLHDSVGVPSHCIGATVGGTAAIAASVAHHGSFATIPPWYCSFGGLAGAASLAFAGTRHAELNAIPLKCKLYTLAGIVAIVAGSVILAKK